MTKKLERYLVLDCGFSKSNAAIAVERFNLDALTREEQSALFAIKLNTDNPALADIHHKVLNALNHKITNNGGQSVDPPSRRRIC